MKSSKNMKTYNGEFITAHAHIHSSKLSSEGEFHYFLVLHFISEFN